MDECKSAFSTVVELTGGRFTLDAEALQVHQFAELVGAVDAVRYIR